MNESPTPPPVPQKKKSVGCFQGCLFALAGIGALVVAFVLLMFFAVGSAMRNFGGVTNLNSFRQGHQVWSDAPEDSYTFLNEIWTSGPHDAHVKAVRIPIRGMITLNDGRRAFEDSSSASALRAIRRATADDDVKALLLEIDSGGGGITASDILYDALIKFKAPDPDRVIVVIMGDIAASGAYYISLPADRIIAHPTTITGSIGVMMESINIKELASKIGIRDVMFKSGENKDLMNPMRDMTSEQEKLLQTLVDQMHERFVGLVALHRRLTPERAKELSDGRIFLAEQAKDLGLIDSIGYTENALNAVRELCNTDHVKFIRYTQQVSFMDLLRSPSFWGSVLSEAMPKAEASGAILAQ